MDLPPRRQRLNLPIAPLVAAVLGGLIALVFALVPSGMLEDFVLDSGIAAVVPAAEPPLGVTARAVLILTAGGGAALVAWFGLFLLIGSRAIMVQRADGADDDTAPILRRADAHPDAPARRPLSANRELGTPFLEVRAGRPVHVRAEVPESDPVPVEAEIERELPTDLDMPLAAFDPEAIPPDPVDWFPEPAPLLRVPRQQVFDPGDRFETFELTPMVRTPAQDRQPWPIAAPDPAPEASAEPWPIGAPTPPAEPARPRASARVEADPSASIHALLDRLERGVGRRDSVAPPPPPREETIQEALVTLRRLATRG
ncbi:MAG: hypothetical protein V4472_08505 [Pseudomonadota bacterium]